MGTDGRCPGPHTAAVVAVPAQPFPATDAEVPRELRGTLRLLAVRHPSSWQPILDRLGLSRDRVTAWVERIRGYSTDTPSRRHGDRFRWRRLRAEVLLDNTLWGTANTVVPTPVTVPNLAGLLSAAAPTPDMVRAVVAGTRFLQALHDLPVELRVQVLVHDSTQQEITRRHELSESRKDAQRQKEVFGVNPSPPPRRSPTAPRPRTTVPRGRTPPRTRCDRTCAGSCGGSTPRPPPVRGSCSSACPG